MGHFCRSWPVSPDPIGHSLVNSPFNSSEKQVCLLFKTIYWKIADFWVKSCKRKDYDSRLDSCLEKIVEERRGWY